MYVRLIHAVMRVVPLAGIVQGREEITAVNRVLAGSWPVPGPECDALIGRWHSVAAADIDFAAAAVRSFFT